MNLLNPFHAPAEVDPDAPPVNAYGDCIAMLHVSADQLDPDEVTRLFGVRPTESERHGQVHPRSDGRPGTPASAGTPAAYG